MLLRILVMCCAVLVAYAASSKPDPLRQAVTFGLTGSDIGSLVVVDAAKCIVQLESTTYFLKNVDFERVSFEPRERKLFSPRYFVVLRVHGEKAIAQTSQR